MVSVPKASLPFEASDNVSLACIYPERGTKYLKEPLGGRFSLDIKKKMQKWGEAKTLIPHPKDQVLKLQSPPIINVNSLQRGKTWHSLFCPQLTTLSGHSVLITIMAHLLLSFQLLEFHTQRVSGKATLTCSGHPYREMGPRGPPGPPLRRHTSIVWVGCLLVSRPSDRQLKVH